ncbi:MAG: toxic anion resistance protein [Pikeienuella sp.]
MSDSPRQSDPAGAVPAERSEALLPVLVPEGVPAPQPEDFTQETWERVSRLAEAVDGRDTSVLLTFGAKAQAEVSAVFDKLLREVSTEEAGIGGDLLVELSRGMEAAKIREMRTELEQGGSGLAMALGRVPGIGPWIAQQMSAFAYFKHRKTAIVAHFDEMERRIAATKEALIEKTTLLDMSYEATERNLADLKVHIAAGALAGRRLAGEAAEMRAEVEGKGDPVAATRYRDLRAGVEAFLTRVVRLQGAYVNGAQSLPQVRQIQETAKIALADVLDTLLVDLPQMKQAILQLTALKAIKEARTGAEKRREIGRELREITATAASESYLEAKESQGRFQDELALLERLAEKVAQTEALARDIEARNAAARVDAAQRLSAVTERLAALDPAG